MSALVPFVMFGWPFLVVGLFALLPARRAVVVAFLFAWLFLPRVAYPIEGLPDYTKMSATSLGALLGVALFHSERLMSFRPSWIDIPMLIWCLCPLPSAVACGLGAYAGVAAAFSQLVIWGFPYLVGRLCLENIDGLRELAVGIVVGGLVYVPLVIYEARMHPQLHNMLYGFGGGGARFYGGFGPLGWQPKVFMSNALALTMFMGGASVVGAWLWVTGALRRLGAIPFWMCLLPLLFATVLCKSLGANVLAGAGIAALFASKKLGTRIPLLCLAMVVPLYIGLRATNSWSGRSLVNVARTLASETRAGSFQTRLDNEDSLAAKARQKWLLGWGPWGDYRVRDERGRDISLTDGLWVIAFGKYGIVGLAALFSAFLVPVLAVLRRIPAGLLFSAKFAPLAAFAVMLTIYMLDCLHNAFANPVLILVAGAVAGFVVSQTSPQCSATRVPVGQARLIRSCQPNESGAP